MNQITKTFDNTKIRIISINGENRAAAIDVCQALGYSRPRHDWHQLKKRKHSELEKYSRVLKLRTLDNKLRQTTTLNLRGVIRLCMLANTPKAVQFRDWATEVLSREITGDTSDMLKDFPLPQNLDEVQENFQKIEKILLLLEKCYGRLSAPMRESYTNYLLGLSGLPVIEAPQGLHKIDIWDLDKKVN